LRGEYMEYIGWMILGVALLVVEIITPIFFFLWFAIGSFIAGIASFFGLSFSWQLSLFSAVSVVLVILTRPIAKKLTGESPRKIYIDEIKGSIGNVVEEINNKKRTGVVRAAGENWKAVSIDDDIIGVGEKVIVERLEGTIVYVRKFKNENAQDE